MHENLSLLQYLRKIQIEWELSAEQLSKITHVGVKTLHQYFAMSPEEAEALPSIPAGLEAAIPLVSVYKNLVNMLPSAEKQNEWLMAPNDTFEGNKPIEVMAMSPNHLSWVSYTLESQANEKRF